MQNTRKIQELQCLSSDFNAVESRMNDLLKTYKAEIPNWMQWFRFLGGVRVGVVFVGLFCFVSAEEEFFCKYETLKNCWEE